MICLVPFMLSEGFLMMMTITMGMVGTMMMAISDGFFGNSHRQAQISVSAS
jgi:hypothetical protein